MLVPKLFKRFSAIQRRNTQQVLKNLLRNKIVYQIFGKKKKKKLKRKKFHTKRFLNGKKAITFLALSITDFI